jgi:hypothetical protein
MDRQSLVSVWNRPEDGEGRQDDVSYMVTLQEQPVLLHNVDEDAVHYTHPLTTGGYHLN